MQRMRVATSRSRKGLRQFYKKDLGAASPMKCMADAQGATTPGSKTTARKDECESFEDSAALSGGLEED